MGESALENLSQFKQYCFFIEWDENEKCWKGTSSTPDIEDALTTKATTVESCFLEILTLRRYTEIIKRGVEGQLSRDDLIGQCENLLSWYNKRKEVLSPEDAAP